MTGPKQRLEKTLQLLMGFCVGCIIGAAAVSWVGNWAWALLAALALVFGFRTKVGSWEVHAGILV